MRCERTDRPLLFRCAARAGRSAVAGGTAVDRDLLDEIRGTMEGGARGADLVAWCAASPSSPSAFESGEGGRRVSQCAKNL